MLAKPTVGRSTGTTGGARIRASAAVRARGDEAMLFAPVAGLGETGRPGSPRCVCVKRHRAVGDGSRRERRRQAPLRRIARILAYAGLDSDQEMTVGWSSRASRGCGSSAGVVGATPCESESHWVYGRHTQRNLSCGCPRRGGRVVSPVMAGRGCRSGREPPSSHRRPAGAASKSGLHPQREGGAREAEGFRPRDWF
jgi:hypothetical protein